MRTQFVPLALDACLTPTIVFTVEPPCQLRAVNGAGMFNADLGAGVASR